jgi:Fic family protein
VRARAYGHVGNSHIHFYGNGRIGRLLVTLFLCAHGVLRKPLLYLSLYLKTHRTDYYRLLQEVREHGAWEAWLEFFLDGVAETANQAFEATRGHRVESTQNNARSEQTGILLARSLCRFAALATSSLDK